MSYHRKCFFTQKDLFFPFRSPIKYFQSAPPELSRSGDGKQIIF